jgi:hypothetical protein
MVLSVSKLRHKVSNKCRVEEKIGKNVPFGETTPGKIMDFFSTLTIRHRAVQKLFSKGRNVLLGDAYPEKILISFCFEN